jgi:hypothetical protein
MAMKFSIKCRKCGKANRPNNNTRTGIIITLIGDFNTCRKCKTRWEKIFVPARPLVKEIASMIEESEELATHIFIESYEGKVPMCIGDY